MEWNEGREAVSLGRTPKKLYRICSEKYADIIAIVTLPVIELYFANERCFQFYYFSTRTTVLRYLDRIVAFFRHGTIPWLGTQDSSLRFIVNECLLEVLDYHSYVRDGPRDQQLFTIFIFQLLFCREAGKIISSVNYGVDHFNLHLESFLSHFGPFPVTAFYIKNLQFFELKSLALFFKYTPHLKIVQLNGNYNEIVLRSIQNYCPDLEEFLIESTAYSSKVWVEHFVRAFFRNLSPEDLFLIIRNGQEVGLSFPKLKYACFYSRESYSQRYLSNFIFLLKKFYPSAIIKWHYHIQNESHLTDILTNGVRYPALIRSEELISLDGIAIRLSDIGYDGILIESDDESVSGEMFLLDLSSDSENSENDNDDEFDYSKEVEYTLGKLFVDNSNKSNEYKLLELENGIPTDMRANFISINLFSESQLNIQYTILAILMKFNCKSLKLTYNIYTSNFIYIALKESIYYLNELYLKGPLLDEEQEKILCTILEQCANLSVLSMDLDLTFRPNWKDLPEMPKLKVLSIQLAKFPRWEHFPNDEFRNVIFPPYTVARYMEDRSIVSKFPAYLKHPGDPVAVDLYVSQDLTNTSEAANCFGLSALSEETTPDSTTIYLPHMYPQWVHLFGPGSVKFDLPASKEGSFGFGAIEPIDNSHMLTKNMKWQYRSPCFAYYGHKKYGHLLKDNFVSFELNKYKSEQDSVRWKSIDDFFPDRLEFQFPSILNNRKINGVYDHVSTNVKVLLVSNYKSEREENELRQWRPDMDYNAPASILQYLIKASPNLRLLELPDLRIVDPLIFICNQHIINSISKVHTLHLSCQFTVPLVTALAKFKSLQNIYIDTRFGVDNFLRFKKNLRNTDLKVEFKESLVYPGSKFVEKLMKECSEN